MGPIDPIGRPTIGGNVILQMYFKKSEEWPKTKTADGKTTLTHAQMIDRIRQDFGPDGPGANDMRAALEYLCTPQGSAKTNSEVSGSYQPPGVASWSVGKIVSGKYVMIIDVIVDEQEGLDTVTMADTDQIEACTGAITKYRTFVNLLKIVPGACHEWAEVARLYIAVEQKQLEYESAVKKLEEMEPNYFEQKELFEGVSAELMRAKEEYAFVVRESEKARGGGLPMEARTQLSKKKIELEKTLSLVRERYIESKSKFLPLRNAWIKNSKAVAIAEFEEEQATQYAEWAKVVFSQCFNYEPSDPEMFSDKFGHGFSSFYEDVEQYELTIPEVPAVPQPAPALMQMSYAAAPRQVVMQAPPMQTVQYVQSAPQMVQSAPQFVASAPSVQYIQQPVNYVQQPGMVYSQPTFIGSNPSSITMINGGSLRNSSSNIMVPTTIPVSGL